MTDERRQIRVFLLDDHEVVRRGVRDLLESEGDVLVVGEASTAAEAMARVPAVRPDVAVLDVRLPDGEPCFPGVPERSPQQILAEHGLKPGKAQLLDRGGDVSVTPWRRVGQTSL